MQALGTRFILFITETEENTLFLVNKTNGNIGILVHWKIGCYILVWVVSCMFDIKELTCYQATDWRGSELDLVAN